MAGTLANAFHKNATHPCDDKRPQEAVQRKLPTMIGFPLLLIPFAIYNIFVFLMPGVAFTAPIVERDADVGRDSGRRHSAMRCWRLACFCCCSKSLRPRGPARVI